MLVSEQHRKLHWSEMPRKILDKDAQKAAEVFADRQLQLAPGTKPRHRPKAGAGVRQWWRYMLFGSPVGDTKDEVSEFSWRG